MYNMNVRFPRLYSLTYDWRCEIHKKVMAILLSLTMMVATVSCSKEEPKSTFDITVEDVINILYDDQDTFLYEVSSQSSINDYTYRDGPTPNEQLITVNSTAFSIFAVVSTEEHLIEEFYIQWNYDYIFEYYNASKYFLVGLNEEYKLTSKIVANMFYITEDEAEDLIKNQESYIYKDTQYNTQVTYADEEELDLCFTITTYEDLNSMLIYASAGLTETETR